MLKVIQFNSSAFKICSDELKNDKVFMMGAMKHDYQLLRLASKTMRNDPVLVQMFRTLQTKSKLPQIKKKEKEIKHATVKKEPLTKQETTAIADIEFRRSIKGIDTFCDTLPALAEGSTGDCAHRVAAVLNWIITGQESEQLPHETTKWHVSLTPIVEDSVESEPVVEIGWTCVDSSLPENQALWNFFHHQCEFVSSGGETKNDEEIESLVAQKRALKPYDNFEELKQQVDPGPGGFVFMAPQKDSGAIGHFCLWLRVRREIPIKCQPDHVLVTQWTEIDDYACDVCTKTFKKGTQIESCFDCDWDICRSCQATEVQFVDPCRKKQNRFAFDESYYLNALKLQIGPLFAFSCTSDHIQEQSYLASMVEDMVQIKQEGGSMKRHWEDMPPREMIGFEVHFSGVTYVVRDYNSEKQLYSVEDVGNEKNVKKLTHTELFSGDIAVNTCDPRLKRRRVS